jgi:hypothetical protein
VVSAAGLPSGNVEIYQHQALWDNRQSPRVHGAFADIYNDHRLWVSFDRAAMRPPQRQDQPRFNAKLFTHWDMDLNKLTPDFFAVKGFCALTMRRRNWAALPACRLSQNPRGVA